MTPVEILEAFAKLECQTARRTWATGGEYDCPDPEPTPAPRRKLTAEIGWRGFGICYRASHVAVSAGTLRPPSKSKYN